MHSNVRLESEINVIIHFRKNRCTLKCSHPLLCGLVWVLSNELCVFYPQILTLVLISRVNLFNKLECWVKYLRLFFFILLVFIHLLTSYVHILELIESILTLNRLLLWLSIHSDVFNLIAFLQKTTCHINCVFRWGLILNLL
jgi:hypothetical protein